MSHETLIGTAEAVERSGIPRSTFLRKVATGEIKAAAKLNGRTGVYLFDPAVIERLDDKADAS